MASRLRQRFVGIALGQADINRRADYSLDYKYVGSSIPAKPDYAGSGSLMDNANSHLVTGFAAGLGFDWMLCAGLFMRAEFEYLRFTSTVDTSVSTGRIGLGYKF